MVILTNKKTKIRFNKLPFLLKDMEKKQWMIDSFFFEYKSEQYIVILTLYNEKERKPDKYAKAKVEFIKDNNTDHSIKGFIDFYEVHFDGFKEFCDFFGVESRNAGRNLFVDFADIFSNFIPEEKIIKKSERIQKIIGSRAEGNNPKAVYCYDVRRNGKKADGTSKKRTIANSNKAEMLRPELYETFRKDTNLNFYFSTEKADCKSDPEIKRTFAKR